MIGRRDALLVVGSGVGIGGFGASGVSGIRGGVDGSQSETIPYETDPDGPEITEFGHDPSGGPILVNTSITLTARAEDPQGRLATIAFGEGRNEMVVERLPASGSSDVATYTYDEAPRHVRSAYPCYAWAESADGRVGEPVDVQGPTVAIPVTARIVGTNSPVRAGERLEVTVDVERPSDSMQDAGPMQDLQLVAGEVVDTASLDLYAGERTTVAMGYETYPVRRDVRFTVTLRTNLTGTVADTEPVEVHA